MAKPHHRVPVLAACERVLDALDTAAATCAGTIIAAIMLIVVLDVVMRYLFNAPLSWSYDIISMYLMLAGFYLALSQTLRRGHHVAVDLLYQHFAIKTKLLWRLLGWTLAAVFFAMVFVLTAKGAWSKFESGDVVAGSIPWPTWVASALAALGSMLIALRLLLDLAYVVAALATGRYELGQRAGIAPSAEPENL
jgi:TRAP-type C4-dicarboxylate transport system permease small subunit